MVFVPLWMVAVYAVVAHRVWAPGGWLFELGALDHAGGLVVEIVSGMSALAVAQVLGPRIGFKKDAMRPHNQQFVLLGCGLLWFGWVHFVGGVVGVLLIGLLATDVMTDGAQGLFYGGGFAQLGKQSLGAVVVGVYAFAVSYVLAKLIDRFMGFRVSADDETTGVDFTQHAGTAYAEGVHGHQPSRRPLTD